MARSLLSTTTRVGAINPVAGSIYDAGSYQDTTSMKIGSVGAQVRTIQVTGSAAAAGDIFTTTIGSGGTDVVATLTLITATAATDTAAATALANNLNTTTGISNVLIATSSTDTVTLTGRQKGASETFTAAASTDGSGGFAVAGAVAPTDATAVQFGTMCERSTATRLTGSTYIGAAVGTGTYTAQVANYDISAALTMAANDILTVIVGVDSDSTGRKTYRTDTTYDTSLDVTLAEVVLELNGILPTNSVIASDTPGTATTLVLTSEIAGLGFDVQVIAYDDSASTYTTLTASSATANACPIGGGIALKALCVEQNSSEVAQWSIGDIFSGLTEGKVYVRLDDSLTVAVDDPAFVRVTAVSPEIVGAFRNAADGTDCLPLSAYGFEGKFTTANSTDMDGNNVAALYLRRTV
tara:strand:+ start:269 stop:1501 length:1233 start_codon:yes stop_codon:yes gene_type:complete